MPVRWRLATACPVLLFAFQQVGDHLGHGGAAVDLAEMLRVVGGHRGEGFGAGDFSASDVVLDGRHERNPQVCEHFLGGYIGVAVVRLHVGDVLHAA